MSNWPRPWSVHRGWPNVMSEDGRVVARINSATALGMDPDWAVAHLMAAAPELLEALEWMVSICGFCDGGAVHEDEECDKCEGARAAIRKAKGEA